jgi:hypothetical protein
MSLLVLYQWTHSEVIFSTSARVSSGPVRNGEPSRVHPVLYSPIVVSARALSSAYPANILLFLFWPVNAFGLCGR